MGNDFVVIQSTDSCTIFGFKLQLLCTFYQHSSLYTGTIKALPPGFTHNLTLTMTPTFLGKNKPPVHYYLYSILLVVLTTQSTLEYNPHLTVHLYTALLYCLLHT